MNRVTPVFVFVVTLAPMLIVGIACQEKVQSECTPNASLYQRASDIAANNTLGARLGALSVFKLLEKVQKSGGCDVGICFALDGSGSISRQEYAVQKEFIKFVADVASLDDDAEFSAVQYGLANIGISPLTQNEVEFKENVDRSVLASAPRTFLSAGLGFCIQDLRRSTRVTGKKIVMLGDGRSNFAEGLLGGVVAQITDELVFAVGVGFPTNPAKLLELTGGDASRVYNVKGYPLVPGIAADVVLAVCNNTTETVETTPHP